GVLNNKYRARCAGRGRCGRGCDIQAAFHSPTALIYPARDSGNLTVRPYSIVSEVLVGEAANRASGVRVIDANTREVMDFKAPVVVLGAGALDTTRILLNSRSTAHPNGLGNSSGVLGCYLSEHLMGIRGSGYIPARIGTEATLDDGRPVAPYVPRFRNVTDRHPDFIRGYHFQGGGGCAEFPSMAHAAARLVEAVLISMLPKELPYAERFGIARDAGFDAIEMQTIARELKVIVAVEEVWNKFLLSPLEFARYVDELDSPWLKAYFDVGNIVFYGYPQDWIRTLEARIAKVHLKDFHLDRPNGRFAW